MDLLSLIIVVALIGFVLWLVNAYVPMPGPWKTALNVIAALLLVIWVLQNMGVIGSVRPVIR
jgi:uncharacterized protein YhhL (DUF1145 family)